MNLLLTTVFIIMCKTASRKQLAEPIVDVYIRESADIGKEIAHPIFRRKGKDIVIYFINIFTHTTAYLDICKCFVALKESLCESLKKRGYQPNVTLQIVPIEHVLHHNTNFDKLKSGCEEIAFSVYNRAMLALVGWETGMRWKILCFSWNSNASIFH